MCAMSARGARVSIASELVLFRTHILVFLTKTNTVGVNESRFLLHVSIGWHPDLP